MQYTALLDTVHHGGSGLNSQTVLANLDSVSLATPFAATQAKLPCHEGDADLWFAERTAEIEQAKTLCRQCPLQGQCLAGAIERSEPWGVWGGEIFVGGEIVAAKRGRGRPRKQVA